MTNTEAYKLARRAVACKGWRWMPGMLVMSDPQSVPRPVQMTAPASSELRARVTSTVIGRWFGVFEYCVDHPDAEHETASGDDLPGTLPDLDDPATLGCLLRLVREAWGEPRICVEIRQPGDLGCRACVVLPIGSEGWRMVQWWCASQNLQHAEAGALVAALEAAP